MSEDPWKEFKESQGKFGFHDTQPGKVEYYTSNIPGKAWNQGCARPAQLLQRKLFRASLQIEETESKQSQETAAKTGADKLISTERQTPGEDKRRSSSSRWRETDDEEVKEKSTQSTWLRWPENQPPAFQFKVQGPTRTSRKPLPPGTKSDLPR